MWSLALEVVADMVALCLHASAFASVHAKFGWFRNIAHIAGTCTCLWKEVASCIWIESRFEPRDCPLFVQYTFSIQQRFIVSCDLSRDVSGVGVSWSC